MIVAEIPFECPECGRPYHMKVDLLKLTRLNRIAVCGRCKHQFNVEVHLEVQPDRGESRRSSREQGHPFRFRPSTPPPGSASGGPASGGRPGRPRRGPSGRPGDSRPPPTSGAYAATPNPDELSPPHDGGSGEKGASDQGIGAEAPLSGRRTRLGRQSPRERHPSWPQTEAAAPSRRRDSKWPISKPRLGWSRDDRSHDTEPSLPSFEMEGEPVTESRASWPDLELELPSRASQPPPAGQSPPPDEPADTARRKDSLLRKRKEIVVKVGDRDTKSRSRRTYRPENLITQPGGYRPDRAQNDDDER